MGNAANENYAFEIALVSFSDRSGWSVDINTTSPISARYFSAKLSEFAHAELRWHIHRIYWKPAVSRVKHYASFTFLLSTKQIEREFGSTLESILRRFCKLNSGELILNSKEGVERGISNVSNLS